MRRRTQTLKLFFLLGALAAASPPPATAPCDPASPPAVRESPARIAAKPEYVKVWGDMQQRASLLTAEVQQQRATARRGSTSTNHLFEDGNATVVEEGKAAGKLLIEPRVTDTNLHAEDAKLKASSAARQQRASSVTAKVSKPLLLLLRHPSNAVLLYPKRVARAVTDEERTGFSEELHGAALGGRLEEMQSLIGQGADVNFRNEDGYTALHWSAASDQLEATRLLIDRGANVNTANTYGTTPLHIASSKNSVKCVVALLGARAIVGAWDQWGWTPLHAAAYFNHGGVVQVLLGAGADQSIRDKEGKTAEDLAQVDAIPVMLPNITRTPAPSLATTVPALTPTPQPAHSSAAASTPASTPTLASTTSQVSPPRKLTLTERRALSETLVDAAKSGLVDDMRQLIGQGADVAHKDRDGLTALHWAAYNCHVDAVQVLLDSHAPVDAANNNVRRPLHYAAWNGQAPCVAALAAAGADLNARDEVGGTPLHYAAVRNNEGTLRALLKAGADPSIKNNYGKTARDLTVSDAVRALLPP